MSSELMVRTVTIANAGTVSGGERVNYRAGESGVGMRTCLVGVLTGPALDNCDLSFEGSYDGATYYPMVDGTGAALKLTGMVAGAMVCIFPTDLLPATYIRLVSSVSQTGAVDIDLIMRYMV